MPSMNPVARMNDPIDGVADRFYPTANLFKPGHRIDPWRDSGRGPVGIAELENMHRVSHSLKAA
jgi:hypothetical protein